RVLGLDRLLHLEQQIALTPGLVDRDHAGAGALVLLVGERAPLPRRRLDENLVAALDQLTGARGSERHAVLVGLDLLRDSDAQGPETLPPRRPATKPRWTWSQFPTRKHGFGRGTPLASLSRAAGSAPTLGWGRGHAANRAWSAVNACRETGAARR